MNREDRADDGEMTIQVFLHRLEKKSLVSQIVLDDLRKLIAQASTPVSAYRLAKVLVDNHVVSDANIRAIFDEDIVPQPAILRRAEEIPSPRSKKVKTVADEDLGFAPDKKPEEESKKQQAASIAASGSLFDEELPPLSQGIANLELGGSFDLWNDPNFTALLGEANPLEAAIPHKKGFFHKLLGRLKRRTGGKLPWPWIGAAGGGLFLLFLLVLWIVNRPDPDEMLVPADALYENGSYAEAIPQYDEYLESYSKREAAGRARVRRGLAQLRLAVPSAANGVAAWDAVKQILPPISEEDTFNREAAVLMADLLPQVAERLVNEAPKRAAPETIARLQDILTLSDSWIPKEDRPRERLGRIEAALRLMQYRTSAKEELTKTIESIRQAISAKNFPAAYNAYKAFRKAFPSSAENEDLAQAMSEIVEAERSAVAWVAKPKKAAPPEPEKNKESVILAYRRFDAAPPDAEGHVIYASAKGAVYGLNAADGKILWRKFVGLDIDGPLDGIPPKPINSQPSSDAVLLVACRGEVLRVEAASGRVRWRHILGENYCSEPFVAGDRIFVATPSGRIVVIDPAAGDSPGYVQLPQALEVAPVVDIPNKLIYQPADHSNLFVVHMTDWRCRQVFPLGHALGTIATPPIIRGNDLLVPIQDSPAHCSVHHILLKSDAKEPLQKVTSLSEAKPESPPPFRIGATSYSVETRGIMPGTIIAAADAKTGRVYWQTHLAVPLVGEPWLDSDGKTNVATALGMIYRLDTIDSEKTIIVDQPVAMLPRDLKNPVTNLVRIGKDICILTCGPGSDLVLAYDKKDAQKKLHAWLSPGKLSCPPIAWGNALLVPTEDGQVFLLDPLTGKPRALPFQPPLQNGKLPAWCSPAVINDRECVIADGHEKLYRLQIADKPQRHLASCGEKTVPPTNGAEKQAAPKNRSLISGYDGVLYSTQLP